MSLSELLALESSELPLEDVSLWALLGFRPSGELERFARRGASGSRLGGLVSRDLGSRGADLRSRELLESLLDEVDRRPEGGDLTRSLGGELSRAERLDGEERREPDLLDGGERIELDLFEGGERIELDLLEGGERMEPDLLEGGERKDSDLLVEGEGILLREECLPCEFLDGGDLTLSTGPRGEGFLRAGDALRGGESEEDLLDVLLFRLPRDLFSSSLEVSDPFLGGALRGSSFESELEEDDSL